MDLALGFPDGRCVGQDGVEPSAKEDPAVDIQTLGIDLPKNVFRIHRVDRSTMPLVCGLLTLVRV
jgi:hypothetical protein